MELKSHNTKVSVACICIIIMYLFRKKSKTNFCPKIKSYANILFIYIRSVSLLSLVYSLLRIVSTGTILDDKYLIYVCSMQIAKLKKINEMYNAVQYKEKKT